MKRTGLSRYWVAGCLGVAILAFIPTYLVMPGGLLIELLNAVAIALGVGVVATYGRGAYNGFRYDGLTSGHLLATGITLVWFGITVRLSWNWLYRMMEYPAWMQDYWIVVFTVWVAIVGGALHLTAQNAIEYTIPASHWVRLAALISLGVLLGLVGFRYIMPL